MRFVLKFKTGADVEFEIPEEDLQASPETMLSVMSRPRWTGSEGAPEVQRIEAPETAEDSWSDGMDAFVVAWVRAPITRVRSARRAPGGGELVDAVAIADWLFLELDSRKSPSRRSSNDGDAADGNLARKVRATSSAARTAPRRWSPSPRRSRTRPSELRIPRR